MSIIGEDKDGREVLECAKCGSTNSDQGLVRFQYAVCCDTGVCTNCLRQLYAHHRVSACLECSRDLKRSDWESKPLYERLTASETAIRKQHRHMLDVDEDAFAGNDVSFDDYLELAEDSILTMAHGTPELRREAHIKLNDAYKRVLPALREVRRRKAAVAAGRSGKALDVHSQVSAPAAVGMALAQIVARDDDDEPRRTLTLSELQVICGFDPAAYPRILRNSLCF